MLRSQRADGMWELLQKRWRALRGRREADDAEVVAPATVDDRSPRPTKKLPPFPRQQLFILGMFWFRLLAA